MSMKAQNSLSKMFDLFWNNVLQESKDCSMSLLDKNHVPFEENREINFDNLENRLAYLYRFGNFNIHLSEKCFESFFENFSEAKNLISKKGIRICTLTNGPGLDLIGLFKSISKSNIRLKSVPDLKIIALHDSWWNISQRLFTYFYEVICSCFEENIDRPQVKVNGIVNDIYSDFSSDTKACIGDSDILLMFKVFYSSKATSEKVLDSMKKILTLLKPGSFIFFLGSKTNTQELSANTELKNFVDCILGPIKISSDLQDDDVIKPTALQPRKLGYGYFVVWKKKGSVPQEQIKQKKKNSNKKNKSKNNVIVTENDETIDSIDTQSEMSFNSFGEMSEKSIGGFKSASYENLSINGIKNKSKRKGLRKEVLEHLFCDSVCNSNDNYDTDFKRSISHKYHNDQQTVSHANISCSHSVKEISKTNLGKKHLNLSLNDLPHSVNNMTSLFEKMQIQPVKTKSKSVCNLDENHQAKKEGKHVAGKKGFNPAKFQDDLLRNAEIDQKLKAENVSSQTIKDETKITKTSEKKNPNVTNELSSGFTKLVSENKNKNLHKDTTAFENKIQSNLTYSKSCISLEEKTLDLTDQNKQDFNTTLLQLKLKLQNFSHEVPQNKSNKIKLPKKNMSQSMTNENSGITGLVSENGIDDNARNSKIPVENNVQSNLLQSKRCTCRGEKTSNISNESKMDFNSLLQRCESLVASLEKLTHSIEKNISSRCNPHFKCNLGESCDKLKPLPACTTSCTRINLCEASGDAACACSRGIIPKRVSNISSPYIVLPVKEEDILHILTSKKS